MIEVLVSIAILFIIITVVYNFFGDITNFVNKQDERIKITLQAKRLQNDIKQWLQMADQRSIECYPISKRVDMVVYEYDLSSKIFLPFKITINYDSNQHQISIYKYDAANYNPNNPRNSLISSTVYLENNVVDFSINNKNNLLSITYEVRVDSQKTQKYEIVHYRRIN